MKIEIKKEVPKDFKPIKIEITIESEDQLETLYEFAKFNVTVPDLLKKEQHQQIMKNAMTELGDLLLKEF